MIDTLTQEQLARIPKIRDQWINIGLNTTPCNRPKVERLIKEVYKEGQLAPPKIIIWLDSPLAGCIGATLLPQVWSQVEDQVGNQVVAQVEDQVGNQVVAQVVDQVDDQVWTQVRHQVEDQVDDQVRHQVVAQVVDQVRSQVVDQVRSQVVDQVRSQVVDQVENQVVDQVDDQVRHQVRHQVVDQVRAQVRSQIDKCGYGTHDSGWLSFYSFFSLYLNCIKKLMPLINLSPEVGWWWPFKNAVIFTEKPVQLFRDDQYRLHYESDMAIKYPDNFGVYAWHGVRVPKHIIIEPEKLTTEMALKEPNQEIKRIILERYGWGKLLSDLNAKVEHEDDYGKLITTTKLNKYLDREDKIAKFVQVNCPSTGRKYFLRTDPNVKTAHEGVAKTFGQTVEQYTPLQET